MIKHILYIFFTPLLFANYPSIETICAKFDREFTLVSLGANDGELALSIAENFEQAQCIMIEDNNPKIKSLADKLLDKCKNIKNNPPLLLNKRFNNSDLKAFSESSYFDVVTILGDNFYTNKRESKQLENYVDLLLNIGWHTFIESKEDSKIGIILASKDPVETLPLENGNCLFYFIKEKTCLQRNHLFGKFYSATIKTTFKENTETYPTNYPTQRMMQRPAGICLINFIGCYGTFPEQKALLQFESKYKLNTKQDIYPHEIFITNKGFKVASPNLPVEGEIPLTQDLLKALIHTKTKAELLFLLKI
jgi:hypothetical protein